MFLQQQEVGQLKSHVFSYIHQRAEVTKKTATLNSAETGKPRGSAFMEQKLQEP